MRHDVLIAVGRYDAPGVVDLSCCERDIAELAARLLSVSTSLGEDPEQTIISTSNGPEGGYKSTVLARLEDALAAIQIDDTLLLAFSGHGLTASGTNYLVPADGNPEQPDSCIPFDWLKDYLDGVTCRFKILLVDACHSGDSELVFKKGARLRFDDRSAVVALVEGSQGVLYASACGHNQVAYVRPDGEQSVWLHALSAKLGALSQEANNAPILMQDVLAEAAVETSALVRRHFDDEQTPFCFQRAEGFVPLGISNHLAPDGGETASLAGVTREAFRSQFEAAFATSMPVEFDLETERKLEAEGWELPLVVHIGPSRLRGRLAIRFDDLQVHTATLDELQDVQRTAERHALDRVILPSSRWAGDLQRRVAPLGRLQLIELPRVMSSGPLLFRDYFVPSDHDRLDVVEANCYAAALMEHMGKLFHVVLADLAAPAYDERYGQAAFGTERAMAFEEDLLGSTIARMDATNLAVDLGCGTGRHTFQLAERFHHVVGYDFSAGMIRVANEKKRQAIVEEARPLSLEFEVRDVEEQPLQFESESIDLVVGCFGMGSFLQEPVPFLAGVKEQLRPGGKLLLSFYNADALVYQAPPPWRDTGLSAALVRDRDELEVTLPDGERFRIFCRAYAYDLLKGQLSRLFDSVQIWSCPAFAAFLPADFFVNGASSAVARNVIASVDRNLATRADLPIGAYFTVLCTKESEEVIAGTSRVASRDVLSLRGEVELIAELNRRAVEYTLVDHRRVRNIDDVRRELGGNGTNLVKAILIVTKDNDDPVVLVLQGSKRLDIDKVSRWLSLTSRQWRFATQKEVRGVYGLEIGGVPPFGYKSGVRVVFDAALARQADVICGVGNPQRSVSLRVADLIGIAQAEIADISAI